MTMCIRMLSSVRVEEHFNTSLGFVLLADAVCIKRLWNGRSVQIIILN